MMVKQYRLMSGDETQVAWLDANTQVGRWVTLKDSDEPYRRWCVYNVFEPAVEKSNIYRGFRNNI